MSDLFDDIDLPNLTHAEMQEMVKEGHRLRNAALREAARRRSEVTGAAFSWLAAKLGTIVSWALRKILPEAPAGKPLSSGGPND
ncbi:MAG: hypothetical protein NXI13_03915 [Proteobacteria bacterium]|nr:hypothetical protein [Pseudomonadota bacterium]